jgi:hypothetical protein
MICETSAKPIEPLGIDLADSADNFGRVGGIQVTQADDRRTVNPAGAEVRISRLEGFIPIRLLVLYLRANSTEKQILIWTRQCR